MGTLAAHAFSPKSLEAAWREVQANDLDDGVIGPAVARFAENLDTRLDDLATDLAENAYEPSPLTHIAIAQGRKTRELQIPSVRDRIVARTILDHVMALVDPHLGPASYAYRPGLGVSDAVQQVVAWRTEGLGWVARTDIDDCFPTAPKDLGFRMLSALVDDPEINDVIRLLLDRPVAQQGRRLRPMHGISQGCPLSPMISNLILAEVDARLLNAGFPVCRYADDLCIGAHSHDDAWEAIRMTSHELAELGMELGADKTAVMSFQEGFAFLGEDFGPRYPPQILDRRVTEPDQKVLYAGVQGGRVRVSKGRLIVQSADETKLVDVPTSHVSRVVCFGSVGLSAGARSWALGTDIDVVFASRKGSYLGSMVSDSDATRPARVRAQLEASGSPQGVRIARAIVTAKISKQRIVLQRGNRRDTSEAVTDAVGQLQQLLLMIPDAKSPMELMGLEGAAAKFYFPCYGQLFPDGLRFTVRSRRPPMDVTNAALSYLYTILLGECVTALRSAGLDPAFGILHSDQEDRPSLALDLIEEFRPLVVDQLVLGSARLGEFKPEHGRVEPGRGILLTKAGKEAITGAYERRMLQRTSALPGYSGTIRRHLYRQAQRLRAAIMDETHLWTGLSWR